MGDFAIVKIVLLCYIYNGILLKGFSVLKKRIFCYFIMLFSIVSIIIFPVSSFGQIYQTEDIEITQLGTSDTYYQFDASTNTLTISGTGKTPNFTSNGASAPWFDWRQSSIDTVIVEEGITGLGSYALYQVRANEIFLPTTLKTLGSYALAGTLSVTQWQLPFGLTSIGSYCFYSCTTLTHIEIPDTVKTISSRAFQNCTSLENIIIPYSVTNLSSYAFYKCTALTKVDFQSLSTSISIGNYAFAYCENLKELTLPLNATVGSYSYGYASKTSKYTDVNMTVFANSKALVYAQANSISYTIYDSIPVECAVGYSNIYDEDNVDKQYTYTFIPDFSGNYNIYTRGDCDVQATLYCNDTLIAENDDISSSDRNFCITAELEKNVEYTFTVSSVKSQGTYTVWIYPEKMISANAYGFVTTQAEKNMTCVDESLLSDIVLEIEFDGEIKDKIYYTNGFFNNVNISQKQQKLNCGNGYGLISIGNLQTEYDLYIEHTYTSIYIDYTLNDDGYNLYTCVLCNDQYKADFVPTTATTVSGKCVLAENPNFEHSHNYPYPYAIVRVNGVDYPVNSDGTFKFNTFNNCYAVIYNLNGEHQTIFIDVGDGNVDYGYVVLDGYDFNSDGVVNGKDFAIFLNEKVDTYTMDYWQFAENFI